MFTPFNYMTHTELLTKIKSSSIYRKKEYTQLRRISDDEVKTELITYVLDSETKIIRKETSRRKSKDLVLARNPDSIGKDDKNELLYNEWLIPNETVKENYGEEVYNQLTDTFTNCIKKKTIHALQITSVLLDFFREQNCVDDNNNIHLAVTWSPEPMIARKGDYLTDCGYSISAKDMENYQLFQSSPCTLSPEDLKTRRLFGDKDKAELTSADNQATLS